MVNFLKATSEILRNKREEIMSVSGIYLRPKTGQSVTIPLSPGRTQFRVHDELGRSFIVISYDFMVTATDLKFDDYAIVPKEDDNIIFEEYKYEVRSVNNEPAWRWTDPYQITRRIHTMKNGLA